MTRKGPRAGRLAPALLAFLASVLLLALLIAALCWQPGQWQAAPTAPLTLYCAASLRGPVEEIARAYEAAYGVRFQIEYGGSQTLLARIEVARRGDLYLPADEDYLHLARSKGLTAETIPVARMTPVLAVRAGNPKKVRGLEDLLAGRVRFALADPGAAAVGRLTREVLQARGQWATLAGRATVTLPTVNEVANTIKVGSVDAGIVWDATIHQYPGLETVPAPSLAARSAQVAIGVLTTTTAPTAALRCARFLTASDKGLPVFQRHGFHPAQGDPWAEEPEIKLFAGAMLRPAIEETVMAFERREGVRITRVYNGCGILVAQMKAAVGAGGRVPDVYFACDQSFMGQVHDQFGDAIEVSTNQLVILVPKGNPRHIRSLADLGQPGLRVGIGHEKQCAMGALTQQTLVQGGFQSAVMKNVKVQSPTGDMLVNQLRTGSLDTVVAYISNAVAAANELDAIKIDIPCAVAVQPMAVSRDTKLQQLNRRLLDALRAPPSRARFEANGFHWQKN